MREQVKIGGVIVVAEREIEPIERREDEPDFIGIILLLCCAVVAVAALQTARELVEKGEDE